MDKRVANLIHQHARKVYKLGNITDVQNLITRLDELLERIKDVHTLRELQAEATARAEAIGFVEQFALGPFINASVAIIATVMAILTIEATAKHSPVAVWVFEHGAKVSITTFGVLLLALIYLAIRGTMIRKSRVAHVLIRDAIERRIEVILKIEESRSSQPNYSAGRSYEPWPPGIPVKN